MKKFIITEEERSRILNMHISRSLKHYLMEESPLEKNQKLQKNALACGWKMPFNPETGSQNVADVDGYEKSGWECPKGSGKKPGVPKSCDELDFPNGWSDKQFADAEKKGNIKVYSQTKKNSDPQDDPYTYIVLNNGKYCASNEFKDPENLDWNEVPKGAITKVDERIKIRQN